MADNTKQVDLGGLTLICNALQVGASTPGSTGTDITVTEGATTLNVGASGTAGTLNVFPATASKGKTVFTVSDNTGNTSTTINTAAQAGARTLTVPDAGASTANFVLSTGTSTATASTSTELNTLNTVVAGTTSASKALVVDSNKRLDALTLGTLSLGAGAGTAVTSTAAELNVLHSVTAGTAAASSAVVLDSGTKINGILNATFGAGTATVAPINLTAGTNLTTAAAGALEFDGTAFYASAVASARQQLDAEQFVIATANSATYSNTLLDTNVAAPVFTTTTSGTAAGAVTVVSGKTYCFEFMYNLTNTGTTSHTWATLFAGNASFNATSAYTVAGNSSGTANAAATGGLSGFISGTTMSTAVVVTPASTSATEQVTITGQGTFFINAGGTIIPQLKASARPGASGTPGVIVLAGSYFRIWEMSSSAAVGNWS